MHLPPSQSLDRNEVLEVVLRIAAAKFLSDPPPPPSPGSPPAAPKASSIQEAVARLLDDHLLNGELWEEQGIKPAPRDAFRTQRLYNRDCDKVLSANKEFLRRVYGYFVQQEPLSAGGPPVKTMGFAAWLKFVDSCHLTQASFSIREAAMAFACSRMQTKDPYASPEHYARSQSLTFVDFLEALGRVADALDLPTVKQIRNMGVLGAAASVSDHPSAEYLKLQRAAGVKLSEGKLSPEALLAAASAPLGRKLEQLLEIIKVELMAYLGIGSGSSMNYMMNVLLGK